MGTPFDSLPDHVKSKIHQQDLSAIQAASNLDLVRLLQTTGPFPLPPVPSSASKSIPSKPELQSHSEFLHWIKKHNNSKPPNPILAIHADPSKPSTIPPGWPDFSLFSTASFPPLFIEFKQSTKSKFSKKQLAFQSLLSSLGHSYSVAFSSTQAIHFTCTHFHIISLPITTNPQ